MSFDYDRTWRERLDDDFADFQPDFIGVSCMFTMTHVSLQRVCSHLSTTGVPIGIGGVHVTNDVERVLDEIPAAGIAFLRESDRAIQIFVKVVNGDLSIDKLGQIILNAQRVDGGRERSDLRATACQQRMKLDIFRPTIFSKYRSIRELGQLAATTALSQRRQYLQQSCQTVAAGHNARSAACAISTVSGFANAAFWAWSMSSNFLSSVTVSGMSCGLTMICSKTIDAPLRCSTK